MDITPTMLRTLGGLFELVGLGLVAWGIYRLHRLFGGKRLKELGKRIGVHLHPHLLRHTVATNMVRQGAPVTAIQQFLGHASLETTQVYLDVEPADIEDAVKRVNFNGTDESSELTRGEA